jgi:branched-chain amino acid transport system permease protein
VSDITQLFLVGIANGGIYALVAIGFIIVSETTRIVNFATGELVMMGAFLGVAAVSQQKLSFVAGYPLVLLAMALIGVVFYFAIFRPLQGHSPLTTIIGTVGIGIALQNIALVVWGPLPYRPPSPFPDNTTVAGAVISKHLIFVVGVTGVLIAALYFLLYRTSIGYRMRAVAQDSDAAQLVGISVTAMFILAWTLAFGLAGVAGVLLGPIWMVDPGMGPNVALKAFAAAIIGGFGSLPGAVVGGIFVGLTEVFGAAYISSAYKDAFVFLTMILFLTFRPEGVFGERVGQRG